MVLLTRQTSGLRHQQDPGPAIENRILLHILNGLAVIAVALCNRTKHAIY